MDIKNLSDLAKYLKPLIEATMMDEVKDIVTETMQGEIQKVVYDVYEPTEYKRQEMQGGLTDPENISATQVDFGVNIRNVRQDDGRDVAQIVESGHGYQHPVQGLGARPFTESTVEKLKETNNHVDALKVGLKKRGVVVE